MCYAAMTKIAYNFIDYFKPCLADDTKFATSIQISYLSQCIVPIIIDYKSARIKIKLGLKHEMHDHEFGPQTTDTQRIH